MAVGSVLMTYTKVSFLSLQCMFGFYCLFESMLFLIQCLFKIACFLIVVIVLMFC